MLSYIDIFDVKKTSLPISKEKLSSILSRKTVMGYVQCQYSNLIQTLKDICEAGEYTVSLNPNEMFNQTNNPFDRAECFIQVEGTSLNDEFINHVINGEDDDSYMNFMTYSETFKDEIATLKLKVIKKYLWNEHNISNWFNDCDIQLPYSSKNEILNNFESFTKNVILSNDFERFIDSCDDGSKNKALETLTYNLIQKIEKYRPEIEHHVENTSKRVTEVALKNPIINRIFILSSFARQCEKEWPKIRFTALDKRSFESLGLWN